MPIVTSTEVIPLKNMCAADMAHYEVLRAQNPEFDSPYFSAHFLKAAQETVPEAFVARFLTPSRIAGYFAFQKRGKVVQPLGAPLNDYHGAVMEAGYYPEWLDLLREAGASRFEFSGLLGPGAFGASHDAKPRQVAKVTDNFETWLAQRKLISKKHVKNLERCKRNLDKDFPGLAFEWGFVTEAILDWVLMLKIAQYERSGLHDVFDCGWTRSILSELAVVRDDSFGLRVGVFRQGETIIAAEICLVDRSTLHFWFPAYAPRFARYSPGLVLTHEITKHLSAKGVEIFDFGSGGEAYKSPMTISDAVCFEGRISLPSRLPVVHDVSDRLGKSLRRRLHIIRACETTILGQFKAATSLGKRAAARLGLSLKAPAHVPKNAQNHQDDVAEDGVRDDRQSSRSMYPAKSFENL